MLVLSRKLGEEILIGEDVRLVVYRIQGNRVRLGIAAPDGIPIHRAELLVHGDGMVPGNKVAKAK
jgi:carbon storage regulator